LYINISTNNIISVEAAKVLQYAKCGSMEDAWRVFKKIPSQNVVSWIHGMAESFAKPILELEPEKCCHVLLSNIYAAGGNRHLHENVEQQTKERGVKKETGCTWIEVNNKVPTFVVDDQDHHQMIEIHAELQRLFMHDARYCA
jgi:pentatricopeptide repeat protein